MRSVEPFSAHSIGIVGQQNTKCTDNKFQGDSTAASTRERESSQPHSRPTSRTKQSSKTQTPASFHALRALSPSNPHTFFNQENACARTPNAPCLASLCYPGYYCPMGSASAKANPCGSGDHYCPRGSAYPTPVDVGHYSYSENSTDGASNVGGIGESWSLIGETVRKNELPDLGANAYVGRDTFVLQSSELTGEHNFNLSINNNSKQSYSNPWCRVWKG